MKKYKQKIIPETSTAEWQQLTASQVKKKLMNEYQSRYKGKTVINEDLGIKVAFETGGAKKTSQGSAPYSKRACLVSVLDKLIRYAEYNNWGDRKETDSVNIIGFLNFKAKVKIDGRLENVHLVVRVKNDGKFHYTMEVNKIQKKDK